MAPMIQCPTWQFRLIDTLGVSLDELRKEMDSLGAVGFQFSGRIVLGDSSARDVVLMSRPSGVTTTGAGLIG